MSAVLVCALAAIPAPVSSSGELSATAWNDPTLSAGFGQNGIVRLPGWNNILGVIELSDGRLLVRVQHIVRPGESNLEGIVRLRADGSLDPSFGANGPTPGSVVVPGNSGTTMFVRASGKILLGDGFVRQYSADGVLDESFGADATHGVDGFINEYSGAVFELDDETIMLSNTDYLEFYRYDTNGVVIPDSRLIMNLRARLVLPIRMPDGGWRVLAAHDDYAGVAPPNNLIAFTADGALDLSFGGGDGVVGLPDGGSPYGSGPPLLIDALGDGRVVISYNDTNHQFHLIRLTPEGEFDATFGVGGQRLYAGEVMSLDVEDDGSMTLGVTDRFDTSAGPYVATVMRTLESGDPDGSFNPNGWTPGSVWLAELGVSGFSSGGGVTPLSGGAVLVSTTQYDPDWNAAAAAQLTRLQLPPRGSVPSIPAPAVAEKPAVRLMNAHQP